jgi:hypothetical protein
MKVWRTSAHHDMGESFVLDIVLDQFLTERRAHKFVLSGDGDVFEIFASPLGDLFHVDDPGDV